MDDHHHPAHHEPATPAESLRAEHEVIEHLLDAMEGMAAALERGARVPASDVESALDVIVGFADRCHHAKEEKVLFGALRDLGTPEALRLVDELEGDHMAGRKLVGTMRAQTHAGESGDDATRRKLARDARLYSTLLHRHIENENEHLLPLSDQLHASTRERVTREFARIEREETGEGAHERYERAVHALHERYAGLAHAH